MNFENSKKWFFGIAIITFIADQLTKSIIRATLERHSEIPIIPIFNIVHVKNTGMAFGLAQGQNGALAILGLVMVSVIVYYGLKIISHDRVSAYLLALVMGGAIGNIMDRLVFGEVTDFLDFYIGVHHWPAFNVADSAICVGAVLLMVQSFRNGGKDVRRS